MKTFKETDDLSLLRVGDILELEDGAKHRAVDDTFGHCSYLECSLDNACDAYRVSCGLFDFHFELQPDEI